MRKRCAKAPFQGASTALKIIRRIADFESPPDAKVGFVPTMGAFHEGHLELMRRAKGECGYCVVSLFVNPLQFGPNEDFSRYPRREETDLEMARSIGVNAVLSPSAEEMYAGIQTKVMIGGISELWEGELRPGHFDGVVTVVAKLFNIVRPHMAYFGEKDFQQCAVISKMAEDLNFRITLRFVETVREQDGLAMSSRNAYLDPANRTKAPQLYKSLLEAAGRIRTHPNDSAAIGEILESVRQTLTDTGFDVDYFALVDSRTLQPIERAGEYSRLIAAAKLGSTRLIDNVPL
jgi:pantoate--beta-alanine ligase